MPTKEDRRKQSLENFKFARDTSIKNSSNYHFFVEKIEVLEQQLDQGE